MSDENTKKCSRCGYVTKQGSYIQKESAGNRSIGKNVSIGDGAKIWAFSVVEDNVSIGADVVIGSHCYIGSGTTIGARSRIQTGVFIPRNTVIEEDVFIGPNVTMTDDKYPRVGNTDYHSQPPYLCRGCSIGANATLLPGVEIGEQALVAAGAVVTHDVPPSELAIGAPAKTRHLSRTVQ